MSDLAFATTTALVDERATREIALRRGELIGGSPPGYDEREMAPQVAR